MPFTVNGVGTGLCNARGDVGFGGVDAVECLVVAFLPVVPYKAVHTFDWQGSQYRQVPIAWSFDLVAQAYLGAWRWPFLIAGLIGGGIAAYHLSLLGVVLALLAIGVFVLLTVVRRLWVRRSEDLRRVLGPFGLGSADPASLLDEALEALDGNPRVTYGTDTYAQAVPQLLQAGRYSQAMWAARLTALFEDRVRGEELTDEVLADSAVADAVAEVRRHPERWAEVMLTPEERAGPPEVLEAEEEDDRPRRRSEDYRER